jgi:hypothetical protein
MQKIPLFRISGRNKTSNFGHKLNNLSLEIVDIGDVKMQENLCGARPGTQQLKNEREIT